MNSMKDKVCCNSGNLPHDIEESQQPWKEFKGQIRSVEGKVGIPCKT